MTTEREMPVYRCYKLVHALKLREKVFIPGVSEVRLVPQDQNFAQIIASGDFARRVPDGDDPGYYVVYKDGYQSWSPTKAFEEGYTLETSRERLS